MEQGQPRPANWAEWCALGCQRPVVVRGLKFAVVVGTILIAINHGDAILRADVGLGNFIKMGLTVVVPFVVSVVSSVGAIVENGGGQRRTGTRKGSVPPPMS